MFLKAFCVHGYVYGASLALYMLLGCTAYEPKPDAKVAIRKSGDTYTLYRNGKPFEVKGAAGDVRLDVLHQIGGNTIRVWDTVGLAPLLKQADTLGVAVIVGLPIPESQYMDHYNDTSAVTSQHAALKAVVNRYKDEPALLMWCVGNELSFPHKPAYLNFYKAFNGIVDMIHQDDPDHPVTTTMVNFQRKDIFNITMRTNVDLISFNIFGRLSYFRDDLEKFSWMWRGPYLITEWGIDGPWDGTAQTAWGAWIEPTSTNKAEQYRLRYEQHMPVEDPGFLGSLIFYWGQKQETTHTWFSLFDEEGNKTAVVGTAGELWTGRTTLPAAPQIRDMLVNGKLPGENIFFTPNGLAEASVGLLSDTAEVERVKWEIYPEDWHKLNGRNNTITPLPIHDWITSNQNLQVTFTVPDKEGPYRIFATVYDNQGNIATCNTPFYVVASDETN